MRHFIYQDEKSHKFWAVEQQGNELHISWGKVGTQGQSRVKVLLMLWQRKSGAEADCGEGEEGICGASEG